MHAPIRLSCLAAALLFSETAAYAGHVLIVDATGGGSFRQIQPAVNASNDGDTVLVRTGTYAAFQVDGKGIDVVADTNAVVHVSGTVVVSGIAADQDLVLSGLNVVASVSGLTGVDLTNCAGSVRFEQCVVRGYDVLAINSHGGTGIHVHACGDVVLDGCRIYGGTGGSSSGPGLVVDSSSQLAMYQGSASGADGADGFYNGGDGTNGANGVSVLSSFFFASGARITGGNGGNASDSHGIPQYYFGGNGGAGLYVSSLSPAAPLLDDTFVGGHGGNGDGVYMDGTEGYNGYASYGPMTLLIGASVKMSLATPQRENAVFDIVVNGSTGDEVYLFLARATRFRYLAGLEGVEIADGPARPFRIGTIGLGGQLTVPFSLGKLPPGVDSRNFFFQCAVGSSGNLKLGRPVAAVLLDESL